MGYDKSLLPRQVVAYLRSSPDRQAERGLSLAVQGRALEAWVEAGRGVSLVATFQDADVSDTDPLQHRAGLVAAIAELAGIEGGGGLVVYRLDRLHTNPIMQALIEAEVRRLGGKLYSTVPSEAAQLANKYEQRQALIREPRAGVPSYQRAISGLRLRVGRELKHRGGGYAYGAPSIGYRAEAGQLVPDPSEQRILERVRELAASGASLRTIAATLTDEGYPTRRGGRWQPTQIARILRND
jgi:DNA invertase Pin-like site-specific DNA recombinase